jgi:hypothetical protein
VITLVLDVSEVSDLDLVIIIQKSEVARLQLFTRCAIGLELLYPRELFQNSFSPFGTLSWKPFFSALGIELESLYLLVKDFLGLVFESGKLVHVVIVAMISLLPGVLDGLLEAGLECLLVGQGDAQEWVVLLERLHLLDLEALLLEEVFLLLVQATEVRVELLH